MKNREIFKSALSLLLIGLLTTTPALASTDDPLDALKSMSLENLMQVTVFSASKQSEQLSGVAAAMSVITHEDIQRSGARTLPDLLRGIPGLSVANMDGHTWAISARGFNGLFANKLLVLIDGRTLYSPLYSGVYWDMQDTLLEDIERIEVIRGPGATIWGANAVNGVINIITRHSCETEGLYASGGAGSLDRTYLNARVGQKRDSFSYRLYAKHLDRDNFASFSSDTDHPDGWTNEKIGFRVDLTPNDRDQVFLQGDLFQGDSSQLMTFDNENTFQGGVEYAGGSLHLQWQRELSSDSSWTLQSYIDRSLRDDTFLNQRLTTWDLSFTHLFSPFEQHSLVWGAGYRYTADRTTADILGGMSPASANYDIFNLFLQDDWAIAPNKLHLIVGSKIEKNDYSDYEIQPTGRFVWTPTPKQSLWGAASRAARTPSRADRDLSIRNLFDTTPVVINTPFGPVSMPANTFMQVSGNPDFKSEDLVALELGYRTQPNEKLSLDVAAFYNKYKNIRFQEAGTPTINLLTNPIEVDIPVSFTNGLDIRTYGLELMGQWEATDHWRLSGSYAWLEMERTKGTNLDDPFQEMIETLNPRHQASLASYLDLSRHLTWDSKLFYFSKFHRTPAHLRCDMRLGWKPVQRWELSFKVENLFDDQHREFPDNLGLVTADVPRNWFAEVKYSF